MLNYLYWKWDGVLSKEYCDFALQQLNWEEAEPSLVKKANTFVDDSEIRRTDLLWQNFMQPLGCITQAYTNAANCAAGWNYGISYQEPTQIARYRGDNSGFYNWHADIFPPDASNEQRKLSCVILLNDPSEFEGGSFFIKNVGEKNLLTQQGSIIVFPSFVDHKVEPVTKGFRYSVASWSVGPAFR
jgi:PKHD-type hydroxylase